MSNILLKSIGKALLRGGTSARLTILTYHRVLTTADPMLPDEVDVDAFTLHMDSLRRHFCVLALGEALARLKRGTLPANAVCITFDDGYANNAEVALPVLQEKGLPACFFIATRFLDGTCMWNDAVVEACRTTQMRDVDFSWLGLGEVEFASTEMRRVVAERLLTTMKRLQLEERDDAVSRLCEELRVNRPRGLMMTPDQIRLLASAGMELGGHTIAHPILSTLSAAEAESEIGGGKEELEGLAGQSVRWFAYPNGRPGVDFGERDVSIVRRLGFDAAVTTERGAAVQQSDPYRLPRFAPWEHTPVRFTLRIYQNALSGAPATG